MSAPRFALLHSSRSGFLPAGLCALICLGSLSLRLHAAAAASEKKLPPPQASALQDQFNREYTQEYCAGKTAILVFDPNGRLLLRTGGREVDPAAVASVVAAVAASGSPSK